MMIAQKIFFPHFGGAHAPLSPSPTAMQGPQNLYGRDGKFCHTFKRGAMAGFRNVFGQTGPQTLGGPQFWTLKIPYKLTCQFQRLDA